MVKEWWREGRKEKVGRNFCLSCKICPHIPLFFTSVSLNGVIAVWFLDVLPVSVSPSLRWTNQSFKAAPRLTYEVKPKPTACRWAKIQIVPTYNCDYQIMSLKRLFTIERQKNKRCSWISKHQENKSPCCDTVCVVHQHVCMCVYDWKGSSITHFLTEYIWIAWLKIPTTLPLLFLLCLDGRAWRQTLF